MSLLAVLPSRVAVLAGLSILTAASTTLTGQMRSYLSSNVMPQSSAPASAHEGDASNGQAERLAASSVVKDIVDTSRGTEPEFHAHALLLLVESNQSLGQSLKLKLAREAFDTAATVSAPIKMVPGISSLNTDSDAGMNMYAYGLGLDRLSLQSRAIADIAALDPNAARKLLDYLSLPEMPPVGCKRALVYDPKSYYVVLQTLANDKKANLKDSRDITEDILYPAVSNLQTHTQVGLALALLADSGLSKDQLASLTGTFVGQLNKLRGDERGFAAEIASRRGITSSERLYQALEKSDPGSGAALLREFRRYLIDNYKAGGCGALWIQNQRDNTKAGPTAQSHDAQIPDKAENKTLPDALQKFNDEFRDGLGRAKLDPITVQDIDVDVPVIKAEIKNYWSDPESMACLTAAKQLKFDENDNVRTLADRESSTWRAQVVSFLGKVDDWEADPFKSAEVFNEKLELYTGVINLTTQDDLKSLAIERSLSMLENSIIESENPAQWLWGVMSVQLRASTLVDDSNYKKLKRDPDFGTRLINSKNRSLHLIGLLESLHLDPFNSKGTGIALP